MITFLIVVLIIFLPFIGLAIHAYLPKASIKSKINKKIVVNCGRRQAFEIIKELTTWQNWASWMIMEEDTRFLYSNNTNDTGSKSSWESPNTGKGSIITNSQTPTHTIHQSCYFQQPFNYHLEVEWNMLLDINSRTVINIIVQNNTPWYLGFKFKNLKKNLRIDCAITLQMLKQFIEKNSRAVDHEIKFLGKSKLEETYYLYDVFKGKKSKLENAIAKTMSSIAKEILHNEGSIVGKPFCLYKNFSDVLVADPDDKVTCKICIPIKRGFTLAKYKKSKRVTKLGANKYALKGPYAYSDTLLYFALIYSRTHALKYKKELVVVYENDPEHTADKDILTMLYI